MCWKIDKWTYCQDCKRYNKVAEKDIEVYKIGYKKYNKFTSYFRDDFSYKANIPNEEIKLYMDSNHLYDFCVDKGHHSYSGECNYFYLIWIGNEAFNIESPLKIYKGEKEKPIRFIEEFINNSINIGKFIIPKGTEYLENENGEIVSTQLIWTGESKCVNDIKFDSPFLRIKLKEL